MERETGTGIRVGTEWAVGMGAVIALIAGMGVLAKAAVIVLVLAGGIGLTIAAFEHGWLFPKAPWKPILILIGIWGCMVFIGWKSWPHDLETASIVWATPKTIDTDTPLSLKELNAKASVAGDFVYDPPLGTRLPIGSDPITVTFDPKDPEKYRASSRTVLIKVLPAPLPIPPLPQKPINTKADLIAEFVSPSDVSLESL